MAVMLLLFFALLVAVRLGLAALNLRHLHRHGGEVPAAFAGAIAPATLRRAAAYEADRQHLAMVEGLVGAALTALFFFGGLLAGYDRWTGELAGGTIGRGLLFYLGLFFAVFLLGLPFDAWRTFRLEARYGFNRTTPGLWLADQAKGLAVALVLLSVLLGGLFGLVRLTPERWWLACWLFFVLFALATTYLSPLVIEPLFFRFEPVSRPGLKAMLEEVLARAGLGVDRLLQVDASRRSSHANAYFSGLGRVKRIVLFDTLLAQLGDREIVAVLAHEAGHWRRRHVLFRFVVTMLVALAAWRLTAILVADAALPAAFGLGEGSFPAQLLLAGFLLWLLAFCCRPLGSALSRWQERQADRFAVALTGRPADLAGALITLCRDNLANLHPHPLYAWFYYTHPPVSERVRYLVGTPEREPAA